MKHLFQLEEHLDCQCYLGWLLWWKWKRAGLTGRMTKRSFLKVHSLHSFPVVYCDKRRVEVNHKSVASGELEDGRRKMASTSGWCTKVMCPVVVSFCRWCAGKLTQDLLSASWKLLIKIVSKNQTYCNHKLSLLSFKKLMLTFFLCTPPIPPDIHFTNTFGENLQYMV